MSSKHRSASSPPSKRILEAIGEQYEKIGKRFSLDLDYLGQKQKFNENAARILREEIKMKLQNREIDAAAYKELEEKVYTLEKNAEVWKTLNKHAKTFEATISEAAQAATRWAIL